MAERSTPATVESHTLTPGEAHRLWNWVLARQGLAPHTRQASVEAIAQAALGLHAARLPSPFATAAARATDPAVALSLFDPATRGRLVTLRCMRKTLHMLPLDLAAAAHAATLHFRERDALRALVNAGLDETRLAAASRALVDLLGETGPMFHRDIETRLAATAIPAPMTRLALKLAWERGTLTYLNTAGGWNREVRTFALTPDVCPGLDTRLPASVAVEQLMSAYLDRYGPVSIRDATWWSGLSRAAVLAGLDRAAVKLVEVRAPWSTSPLYMSAERFTQFTATSNADCMTGICLLAHEDVALKAYFETRARYLGDLAPSVAFNQIGEVLSTVLLDGRVVGTWMWDQQARRVRLRLVPRAAPAEQRDQARVAAAELTKVLRIGQAVGTRVSPDQMVLLPASDALLS
ncbi:winged helix DNA-binding domain-containing protein [Sphaerisporangium flaviroseum]|uniref:Winged helix DNA-binding domain-containing protein n=1 Tax=Sphaerisporangium flaviroseum TaxID=509199 RepID=A0ABP7JFU5_9ACTN